MVSAGRVLIMPKGAWNTTDTYSMLDLVSYNGSSYVAKTSVPANTLPTNTSYWQLSAYGGSTSNVDGNFALTETTDYASRNYTVGDFLVTKDSVFCKVKASITTGDQLVMDTNIEATSVAALYDAAIDYADELDEKSVKLQGQTAITTQTDLNDLTTVGNYYKSSTAVYVTNAPTGIASELTAIFRLTVENGSDTTDKVIQTLFTNDGKTYKRGYNGSTWSTWAELASAASVSTVRDAVTDVEETVAPVEASTTFAAAYSIGDQFYQGDVLYEAIASIDIGDTLTVGTNVKVADTVTEQIATVNSDLSNMNNPNLLDNPYFVVNQRGESSYNTSTAAKYTVDRWWSIFSTVAVSDDGVTLGSPSGLSYGSNLRQICKADKRMRGGKVTFSVNLSNIASTIKIAIYKSSGINSGLVQLGSKDITSNGIHSLTVDLPDDVASSSYPYLIANISGTTIGSSSAKILNAKLEIGGLSTIANDEMPDYAIELAKCKASTADPNDTYANQGEINVGPQSSNRNLLDNPWFTVNQRGQSSYVSNNNTYTVDRWDNIYPRDLTVDVTDDGVTLTSGSTTGASSPVSFTQRIEGEVFKKLIGKTITLSVMLSDGTIKSATATVPLSILTSPDDIIFENLNGNWKMSVYGRVTGLGSNVQINCYAPNSSLSVRAMKLEVGSVSTLALDTAPNYAEELLKCQRYYVPIATGLNYAGIFNSTTQVKFNVPVPVKMRTTPTVTGITNMSMSHQSGAFNTASVTGMSIASSDVNGVGVKVDFTLSSGTPNQYGACTVQLSTNAGALSADL